VGEGTEIRPPLYCDHGSQTHVGARTSINFGVVLLDVATSGSAATSRLAQASSADPDSSGGGRGAPGQVGGGLADRRWRQRLVGRGVIVCPGVSIGTNTVVGAGAVVVRDLPADVVAVGNPARVIRSL
jgi:maltose O-acetyltransferase